MRKILLLLIISPLFLSAQNQFGFYYHSEVLNSIPEYHKAQKEYELLKLRCDAEIERNEQELTRYYVAYLDGQQDFPEPILRKRQKELQQMIDNSVALRDQLNIWLSEARDSLFAPCEKRVDEAVASVCLVGDLSYAINAEEIHYRYINPNYGVNITQSVINFLNPAEVKPVEIVTRRDEESSLPAETQNGEAEGAGSGEEDGMEAGEAVQEQMP